jgi:nickel transport protein
MKQFNHKTMVTGIIYSFMLSMLLIQYAFAHKVTVFAWVEGDTVYTESKFSGGKKTKNALIEVFDSHGNKILDGRTDDNGSFSFKAPQKSEMKIVLLAGMGHRGEWTITSEDFDNETAQGSQNLSPQASTSIKPDMIKIPNAALEEKKSDPCLTSEDIQSIVETAIKKQLAPVKNKLNKFLAPDSSPSFSDILGGIGYIFGLMGIGAYFNYRKKKE